MYRPLLTTRLPRICSCPTLNRSWAIKPEIKPIILRTRCQRFDFSTSTSIYKATMVSTPVELQPPVHRGMTAENFDKNAFNLDIEVLAAKVPALQIGKVKKELAGAILSIPRIASIVADTDSKDTKLLLLNKPNIDDITADVREKLSVYQLVPHRITLDYSYWNANQILRAILPEELLADLPSSFTVVGHIAHFNLRDEYLAYKKLIGQVVLDKNPSLETVVNKLDTIDNEFRFFQMEVLAGKPEFEVTTSENGCIFRFDFSKVYWNSRLQTEHTRLVDSFDLQDVVADGFAGVGPFAIPAAAKRGVLGVLANDLNPASAASLRENVKLNKVEDIVRCYNMDGGEFFRQAVQELYDSPFASRKGPRTSAGKAAKLARRAREAKKQEVLAAGMTPQDASKAVPAEASHEKEETSPPGRFVDHFVMNLPATAIDLLGCFDGIYTPFLQRLDEEREAFLQELKEHSKRKNRGEWDGQLRLPMVHCYCFTKELEAYESDICKRATASLGYPVSSALRDYSLSLVRSVAPNKDMYRLSFRLPKEVVFKDASVERL